MVPAYGLVCDVWSRDRRGAAYHGETGWRDRRVAAAEGSGVGGVCCPATLEDGGVSAAPINPQGLDGEGDAKKTDRKSMVEMILRVMNGAGGEAPRFAVMAIRDWWYLRRGPKWRFPLPDPTR